MCAIWIFTKLQPFNFNLQQDLKIAAFWENPEKNWSTFSKISAKFWQNLQHFVKKQQNVQQFSTKKLRLENGIAAAFQLLPLFIFSMFSLKIAEIFADFLQKFANFCKIFRFLLDSCWILTNFFRDFPKMQHFSQNSILCVHPSAAAGLRQAFVNDRNGEILLYVTLPCIKETVRFQAGSRGWVLCSRSTQV